MVVVQCGCNVCVVMCTVPVEQPCDVQNSPTPQVWCQIPTPCSHALPNSRSVSLAVGQDGWLVVAEAAEEEEVVPREGVIYVVL